MKCRVQGARATCPPRARAPSPQSPSEHVEPTSKTHTGLFPHQGPLMGTRRPEDWTRSFLYKKTKLQYAGGVPTQADLLWKERGGGLAFPRHIAARNSKEAQPASSILALGHHEDSPPAQEGSDFHS